MDSKKQSLGSAADSVNAAGQAWPRLEALVAALAAGARPAAAHVAAALAEDFSAAHVLVLAREQDREDLVALGSAGLEAADRRGDLLALARRLAGWVAASRLPLSLTDPAGDPRFAAETDYSRPIQVVPLVIGGSVEGALLVFDAAVEGDPARAGRLLQALGALGGTLAVAIELERARRGLGGLAAHLDESEKGRLRAERLAFAADMAARTAREVQATLASLGGIAARLAEETEESDPRQALLEVMAREVERLDRLFTDQIELVRGHDRELRPDDLNRVLAECLMLVDTEVQRHKLRVTRRLAPGLPSLLLDTGLLRRVFLNLLRAAVERAPEGGRIKVESRRRGDLVEAVVASDGRREPGAALEDLWVAFRPEEADRGGPSYAAAERILREHRGTLRVIANNEWPLQFLLTLPIPGNQDRRRPRDRRGGGDRRRA